MQLVDSNIMLTNIFDYIKFEFYIAAWMLLKEKRNGPD